MSTPTVEQHRPKILVVDDHAGNRALAQATLEDEDYDVIIAATGSEGIRAFEREHPDCILLDIRMPDMDGLAVCSHIRGLPGGALTPIIFLTALRDVATFDQALLVGGDDFITKPVRPTELIVRVETALKLRRMSTDLRQHYELVRRQRDDLMRLKLQKEQLTTFLVHDLKNPVNSVDLNAQVVLRARDASEPARDAARRIRDEARSLLNLILNLLDINRSEEGQLSLRLGPIDLEAMVSEVIAALELRADSASVTFKPTLEARSLGGDPQLLRRVIENLLDNAIRHAPARSEVQVTMSDVGDAVEIRVADAGPGIAPELRLKIFERYFQIDRAHRVSTVAGRGLGLAFCKIAVEAHGGTIWVEDGEPGAMFCVRLPRGAAPCEAPP
ncbi:MAG TPA: hybrid sensor histidine kinase/response regulator [Polyangia bacterium]|jgi:signal transduction histidine kinase|nr:hybrid sensor histidine kinase/response regulator [Polyangia bacterium]